MRLRDLFEFFRLPRASINLMYEETSQNDPFYGRIVKNFYDETQRRHPKLPLTRRYEYGFALCELPADFDAYFAELEASARCNYRKAAKLGYEMRRFDYNSRLEDIRDIWLSTPVRQGRLPKGIREGRVRRTSDAPSMNPLHDYPYYGIFNDHKLLAYAGCMISGELCSFTDIYGHARHQKDGLIPMLIVEIARTLYESYPRVRYYAYGTYFGASESMRRFKRKFLFYPHRVRWILQTPDRRLSAVAHLRERLTGAV